MENMKGINAQVPKSIIDSKGDTLHFQASPRETFHQYALEKYASCSIILRPALIELEFMKTNRPVAKDEIIQQGRNECAIASMAMFISRPVEDVRESFRKFAWDVEYGVSVWQQKKVLRDFGYTSMLNDVCPNDQCMFTLKSLNVKGKNHAVYWNGTELLDPQTNNPNVKWYGPDWGPISVGGFQFITKEKIKSKL